MKSKAISVAVVSVAMGCASVVPVTIDGHRYGTSDEEYAVYSDEARAVEARAQKGAREAACEITRIGDREYARECSDRALHDPDQSWILVDRMCHEFRSSRQSTEDVSDLSEFRNPQNLPLIHARRMLEGEESKWCRKSEVLRSAYLKSRNRARERAESEKRRVELLAHREADDRREAAEAETNRQMWCNENNLAAWTAVVKDCDPGRFDYTVEFTAKRRPREYDVSLCGPDPAGRNELAKLTGIGGVRHLAVRICTGLQKAFESDPYTQAAIGSALIAAGRESMWDAQVASESPSLTDVVALCQKAIQGFGYANGPLILHGFLGKVPSAAETDRIFRALTAESVVARAFPQPAKANRMAAGSLTVKCADEDFEAVWQSDAASQSRSYRTVAPKAVVISEPPGVETNSGPSACISARMSEFVRLPPGVLDTTLAATTSSPTAAPPDEQGPPVGPLRDAAGVRVACEAAYDGIMLKRCRAPGPSEWYIKPCVEKFCYGVDRAECIREAGATCNWDAILKCSACSR